MSIHNKRNQITVTHEKLTSTYNDSGTRFLYDNNKIHNLDLASGLVQLLAENNFTLESLLDTSSSKTLGIDQEVATLICKAAKNKKMLNV
jgi:hypothetical protein